MQFITNQYVRFFKDLAQNNQRDWFQENKKRYEQHVRNPFLDLLENLIPVLQESQPDLLDDPKKCVFRINRDIRFSKDKTPYNVIMKAGLSPHGKKSEYPGFYLGISAESAYIGGGLYNPASDALKKVRAYLVKHVDEFVKLYNQETFTTYFEGVQGDRAKRIPKEWSDAAGKSPYIMNKQFYAMADVPVAKLVKAKDQIDFMLPYFKAVDPLIHLLRKAYGL